MDGLGKAIAAFGTQRALAAALGVSPMAISQWRSRGSVPAERVLAIESATRGRVHRSEIRPDLYPPDEYPALLSQQAAVP